MHANETTLQMLAESAAAQQRQADLVQRYRNAGDEDTARFLDRPAAEQRYLLSRQALRDASLAVDAGDRAGVEAALAEAIRLGIKQPRVGVKMPPRRRGRR
jgi:hypothetical protein